MTPAQIWFIAGLVLVITEFTTPGVVLVFLGLGAWCASLTAYLGWTASVGSQMAVFAVSSLVLLIGLRRFFKSWFMGFTKANPDASRDLDDYIGRQVRVITPIAAGGDGKVEFKGAHWNAVSPAALAVGDHAVITRMDGLTLTVEPRA